jgi:hypothetical protein
MKMKLIVGTLALALAVPVYGQESTPQQGSQPSQPAQVQPKGDSAGHDVGSGTGDIGKGAAKGTGHAAEGVGKGAGDLVTLHPIKGATAVGKGAGEAGKDVGVGMVKGTGKVLKGTGKAIKHVF